MHEVPDTQYIGGERVKSSLFHNEILSTSPGSLLCTVSLMLKSKETTDKAKLPPRH